MNDDFGQIEQQEVIDSYKKRGFIKNKNDEQSLHMAYSPYKIPKNLSRQKIRYEINNYLKNGCKYPHSLGYLLGNRVEIIINGKVMLSASTTLPIPNNSNELHELLKNLIKFVSGKDVPDKEVLGKYSPPH